MTEPFQGGPPPDIRSRLGRGRRAARSRRGRAGLAAGLVAIGAAGALLAGRHSAGHAVPAKIVALGTSTVHRGALITTQRDHGRLRYPSRSPVHLGGAGVVTSLPRIGRILTDGAVAAEVDDQPIGVLYGAGPLYRVLGTRSAGGARLAVQSARADLLAAQAALAAAQAPASRHVSAADPGAAQSAAVAQAQVSVTQARRRLLDAQRALAGTLTPQSGPDVALVSGDMTALGDASGSSDRWTPALQTGVARWQRRLGAAPTGRLDPGAVLVIPGASRVRGIQGHVGDAPAAVSLLLSSATRVATFSLRDGAPSAVRPGVRVRLSAGSVVATGQVTSVVTGSRATAVQVALPPASRMARGGATRVTMTVTTQRTRHALLVSTQALLALSSGGYALQLPSGRLVAVHTGSIQGGEIAVSGPGVRAGLKVVSVR